MLASKKDLIYVNNDYLTPSQLLRHILNNTLDLCRCCLFLDIDGTISEFHLNPSLSFIAHSVIEDINTLLKLGIPVLVVTGRSIEDATRLVNPLDIPLAATHGLEIRKHLNAIIETPTHTINFNHVHQDLQHECKKYPKFRIEKKSHAVALHYRECPENKDIAKNIMINLQTQYAQLKLNHGKYVYELILKEANKGLAILKLIKQLNLQDFKPIFIGDDLTDETGFKSINQLNGVSVKVGEGLTYANNRLKNVDAVCEFIRLFKNESLRKQNQTSLYLHHEENNNV